MPGTHGYIAPADLEVLTNPGDPTLTAGGVLAFSSPPIIVDRWPSHNSYTFEFRAWVNVPAGIGWGYINVPSIAGFRPPKIYDVGGYRSQTLSPQQDNAGGSGGDGAGPRGPFMGKEYDHWSSTQRIYCGYYRRDNAFSTYVGFIG